MRKTVNDRKLASMIKEGALRKKEIAEIDAEIRRLQLKRSDLSYKIIPLSVELATGCPHENIQEGETLRLKLRLQICKDCGCSRVRRDGSWDSWMLYSKQ